jgi:hypothetical protein
MADQGKEFSRPEKFAPLYRVYIFIIQVKPNERDRFCTEFISCKNCTITVRKSSKVVHMRERGALRGGNNRTFKSRHPVSEQGHIITMRMNYDNRARFIQRKEPVGSTVKISKNRIRADIVCIKHFSCSIRREYDTPNVGQLVFQAGRVSADSDFIVASERSQGEKIVAGHK